MLGTAVATPAPPPVCTVNGPPGATARTPVVRDQHGRLRRRAVLSVLNDAFPGTAGVSRRSRALFAGAKNECGDLIQELPCNVGPCATNCEVPLRAVGWWLLDLHQLKLEW